MSLEDKARLEQEMRTKVIGEMNSPQALADYILFTLDNFSYRYLKEEKARVEDGRLFVVDSIESDLMVSLKASNDETKKGLIAAAKARGKEGMTVQSSLQVKCLDQNVEGGGIFHFLAKVEGGDFRAEKTETCDFDDIVEVRNKLAFYLEKVSEVF